LNLNIREASMAIFDQVDQILLAQAKTIFSSSEIRDLCHENFGANKSSVLPSDYCYNRTNHGIGNNNNILIFHGYGEYEYVGRGYKYNGPMLHKVQSSKEEIIVGNWTNGEYVGLGEPIPYHPNVIDLIEEFSRNYLSEKSNFVKATKTVPSWSKLIDVIPAQLKAFLKLPGSFKVVGSIGKGNITEIPWICFFDTDITTSAQNGYYIVILFRTDMKGFYISLNQGWTQYEAEYGVKKGKDIIQDNVKVAQSSLRTIGYFDRDRLELGATRPLGKGYELGNICSIYIDLTSSISINDFYQHFRGLLAVYSELKGAVGADILNIKTVISEESYQTTIQSSERKTLEDGPIKRKSPNEKGINNSWPRNPNIAKAAIELADNKCEIESDHLTFISEASSLPFMEAHHLVPMEFQGEFTYSLDVPENIVSLCPNCHRKIHLSKGAEKEVLISKLFNQRAYLLRSRGITVSSTKMCSFYE
jgi:5-methylcytosine-specific restriction protein A